MIAFAIALASLSQPQTAKVEDFWWIFIERAKKVELSDNESAKMMGGHLGNFRRLFGLGSLTLAGPLQDPTEVRRGVVLLTVKDQRAVDDCFKPDPFVQAGIFAIKSTAMRRDFGHLNVVPGGDPNSIGENRLVVFEGGHGPLDWPGKTDWLIQGQSAGLVFHAQSIQSMGVREIALCRGADDNGIRAWLAMDPRSNDGLRATVYPQWLAKGLLPERL